MGVRGLTSFIARHAELYLQPFELHDCNLVIDGDNLACNLYKDVTGTYSAFGGDYDDFYRSVVEFFHVLAECNVHAYVLMDGGYEQKKLRTVGKRLRGKISVIKRINPCGSIPVFPVMMKEVFVDAVRDCGVPLMRCIFEADDELAALSRKLNCPVLSYDSDFYIHNVRYIPLITLTVKAHTKRLHEDAPEEEDEKRKLRRNEVKNLEKRTKSSRILSEIQVDAVEKRAPRKGKTYKYLDCCMYKIDNLIARGSLSKEKLPLFAALLGNDYIARSSFKNFFANSGKGSKSRKLKQQQRRIKVILQWLKHETAESAMEKIMSRLRMGQRKSLMAQMEAATSGYSNEECFSYDFFLANYEDAFAEFMEQEQAPDDDDEENETAEDDDDVEQECTDEEEVESDEEQVQEESKDAAEVEEGSDDSDSEGEEEEEAEGAEDEDEEDSKKSDSFPDWFLDKLYPAHLSRFFVDLVHLKKYINSPQIEHFPHNDCHEIALPILTYIFTLLNNVEGAPTQPEIAEDGTEIPIEFTYLTRATRVTNIRYYRFPMETPPSLPFDPRSPNPLLLRHVFTGASKDLKVDHLFEQLEVLPSDLRLYFLAIVYWLQKSQHVDLIHLHSLLICLVVLRTIDTKIPPERDMKVFQKRFGKIIKKERLVREKEALEGVKRTVKEELRQLSIPERMEFIPKSDCYLVQDNLLKHFHMQELFKKKYDLYSTTVLHAFAEFQSLAFQLHALNALLDFPLPGIRMGQSYCGVFLYNMYDLLRVRLDHRYYVQNFVFRESQMMFDLYAFLLDWCEQFVPAWKRQEQQTVQQSVSKKVQKKRRQAERKKTAQAQEEAVAVADPNADMVAPEEDDEDEFFDLNNKFCTFLKVK